MNKVNYPFRVVVNKEISDHVKSWRFIILMGIILLTCMGSLYTSLTNIGAAIKPNDPDGSFLFLKLFTASDGTLPSFVQFINFLGPLLGIALGFDAINSEQNKGTLSRMLSQPVHRDCIINAKFVAALIVIGIMLFVLGFLVMGCGLIAIGLADVLIKNPEIIILDEPTSGIDPAGVQEFIELIRQLSRKEGLTVLFSSHHLDQVQKVCDRVGLFNSGKLVTLIDMSDLKDKHQELSDIYNHYMEEGGERHE